MYLNSVDLFWIIIAILMAGVLLGRSWWYITSKEENIHSSKLVRGSSSYLLGMNYLISNQPDLAVMELSRAAKKDPSAIEARQRAETFAQRQSEVAAVAQKIQSVTL